MYWLRNIFGTKNCVMNGAYAEWLSHADNQMCILKLVYNLKLDNDLKIQKCLIKL